MSGSASGAYDVAAVLLAAGRSVRMGGCNKLVAAIDGVPVVRRAATAVIAAGVAPVLVVTGHERVRIEQALEGLTVRFVHNADYADGLSTSLRRGIAALPERIDGTLVCLGDMPWVREVQIERLVAAFDPDAGRAICVPTFQGRRGNPVLWGRAFFPAMEALNGDQGARELLTAYEQAVFHVVVDGDEVIRDVDTVADLGA